jgi:hypothetical protein
MFGADALADDRATPAGALGPRLGHFSKVGRGAVLRLVGVLALASRQREKQARELLSANPDALGTFPEETKQHMSRYALSYVWPQVAEKWGTTWQMAGLLCLLLGGVFLLWSLLTFTLWYLAYLVPIVAGLFTGGAVARRIKIHERVREDLKDVKSLHDSVSIVVNLKTAAGKWPPQPPPEGG